MARETQITIIGNLTDDPTLRFTQNGSAVADFTVASTPSTFNRQANQWEDGTTLFMRCSAWNDFAENISESLRKGMRVIVQGSLVQRQYEDRNGQQRTVVELRVDEVGPSLRFARAQVTKAPRGGQQGQQMTPNAQAAYAAQQQATQADDPWGTQQQGAGTYGNPPF